jgi:hypothetical protein
MAKEYRPRRQSTRWLDADCPPGVLATYDDPRTQDRYWVFYADCIESMFGPYVSYRAMCSAPCHPLGFAQWGYFLAHELADYRRENKRHACKWSSLPEDVKRLVWSDLQAEEVAA